MNPEHPWRRVGDTAEFMNDIWTLTGWDMNRFYIKNIHEYERNYNLYDSAWVNKEGNANFRWLKRKKPIIVVKMK